jgi:hypothetical protein
MDLVGHTLVVGLARRTVKIYDLRYLPEPVETRDATLKHMLRQVSFKCLTCLRLDVFQMERDLLLDL